MLSRQRRTSATVLALEECPVRIDHTPRSPQSAVVMSAPAMWDADRSPLAARDPVAWLAGRRARRVFLLLLAVWLLNAFDLTLTMLADADGILEEGNPIARAILARGALTLFAFKIITVFVASVVMFGFRRYRCTEIALFVVLAAYTLVAVKWHVCYAMYDIGNTRDGCLVDIAWLDTMARYFCVI